MKARIWKDSTDYVGGGIGFFIGTGPYAQRLDGRKRWHYYDGKYWAESSTFEDLVEFVREMLNESSVH